MANPAEEVAVRKSVRVQAPIEHAFSVFVEQMETWWPQTHHIGSVPFVNIFVEPRVGGRWYERNAEGAYNDWGKVLVWEPPHRVTFSWHMGPGHDSEDWVCDPDIRKASEVEIHFVSEGPTTTLVHLTHSRLERHGKGYEQLHALFDSPGAWSAILEEFAKKAQEGQA